MVLFKAENIVKKYQNHTALDKVNMEVPEGCIFGLLGPNGAGKTSLIRIINQITRADSGKIYINGELLNPSHISEIGYLPEERGLYKKMKVGEQALYLAQLKGMDKRQAKRELKLWFEKFEIPSWWNKKIEELSKGMAQKVQFITTVLHQPKILILDEPFSGFDPINANIIKEEILNLKEKGTSIFLSTHNMGSVEEICDYIALINKSKKILDGKVSEIKKQYTADTYKVEFKGNMIGLANALWADFDLVEKESIDNENHIAHIKLSNGKSLNDLVSALVNHIEIKAVNQLSLSMNDIFIKVVQSQNQN